MTQAPDPTFSAQRLIEHHGGIAALQHQFRQYGWDVKYRTIQKWRERGSIPPKYLARIALMAKQSRRKLDLADFVDAYPVRTNDDALKDLLG